MKICSWITLASLSIFPGTIIGAASVHAETESLPESRHQQTLTMANLFEEQTVLVYRNGGRAWLAIAGSLALAEFKSLPGSPQLIAQGSANASFRLKSDLALLTETIDAKAGLGLDFTLSEKSWFTLSWVHYSGHATDEILDFGLFGSNLGYEQIRFRWVGWHSDYFRGLYTFQPFMGTEPARPALSASQEINYFPWGVSGSRKEGSAYFALMFEESGPSTLGLSTSVQAGWLFGNRSRPIHDPGYRALIGYYNGWDPRLKYQGFRHARADFVVVGIAADL